MSSLEFSQDRTVNTGETPRMNGESTKLQHRGNRVTGKVLDTHGEPVIGGTVLVKNNPTQGTVTDIDGNFSLSNILENSEDPSERFDLSGQHPEIIQEIKQILAQHLSTIVPVENQLEK